MPCTVEQRRRHSALGHDLDARPAVECVDVLAPGVDPSGRWTSEVILASRHAEVPPAVLRAIADAQLGVADVTPRGAFGHLRIVIR